MEKCPYCHAPLEAETPCMAHPPVPMSYWPKTSASAESEAECDEVPQALIQRAG